MGISFGEFKTGLMSLKMITICDKSFFPFLKKTNHDLEVDFQNDHRSQGQA